MEAEAGMTSFHSAYANVKNASSGILIRSIHRDARCLCVQTRASSRLASSGRVLIPPPQGLNQHLRSHHLKTKNHLLKVVMEAEAGMTSFHSAYANVKNASSGILIRSIHRDARCLCVQTRASSRLASSGRVLIPPPQGLNQHLRSHHLKTKKPPVKGGDGGGGGNRTRECRFCKPMPYHLATPP